jgi:HEAT repeat protein
LRNDPLASFARPEALPLLRQLANDQDPDMRNAARGALKSWLKALGSTSWPETLPLLRQLVNKDQDRQVRIAALEALGRIAVPEDLPLLRRLANDQDPGVREAALVLLR